MSTATDVRPSPIAGQWYQSDPARLSAIVDGYINAARMPEIRGEVIAVMAPHAGHKYSGPVAGYSFAALRGLKPDVVAVVSPMHHPYYEPLLTTSHAAYATPLGNIDVDHGLVERLDELLRNRAGLGLKRISRDPEHSLEIELPFLQRILKEPFKLLPVMVRDQGVFIAQNLGQGLAEVLSGQDAVLVASTDLSHFYPQPVAEKYDREFLNQVEKFNPQLVIEIEEQGKGFACGRGALAAVMWAARALGANRAQILNYGTSGDVTGDTNQVVGYASAVFARYNPED
jgi:AmmeMemoRadiSam system protein B